MLVDSFNRTIDYLRISVTDRCNLRCTYCMPEEGIVNKPHEDLLTFEEIARIVRVMCSLGINKIRLTGGEPLVRKGIIDLIKSLSGLKQIKDFSMTTNGILLNQFAFKLKEAGIKRLNISLDSLDNNRYAAITRFGNLGLVKKGIEKALLAGFSPLKVNVLLLADIGENEVNEFLNLTQVSAIHIRFLELMPAGDNSFYMRSKFISCEEIMKTCYRFGPEVERVNLYGSGPARTFKFKGFLGTFGFISPISNKFCSSCNRLRLTSDGFLKGCLHSDLKIGLRNPLRKGICDKDLTELIKSTVNTKPKEHSLDRHAIKPSEYFMCQIGG